MPDAATYCYLLGIYHRCIALEDWQRELTQQHPAQLIRGHRSSVAILEKLDGPKR